jgi:hypothetical protein
MPTSIVKVYDKRYSQWAEGAKVGLGWSGFINLGMSKNVYTDSNGRAVIDHTATGDAEVYINGTHVGNMYTPGSSTFEI